jgi:hypothetical protein
MDWEEEPEDDELRSVVLEFLPQAVVWTTDWTTGSLIDQLQRGVFDVDPPFQRRSVWDDVKASLYIESLLLGCPVPPITLAEASTGHTHQYIVIDGKQRLNTLKRFALDETLSLRGLEMLVSLKGSRFSDVQGHNEFGRFENLPIRTNVVRNWKHDEVLHFIFNRLNTQVTPLSTHELRRSLIPGPFMSYLDVRSAKSPQLWHILGISEPDRRLRDAELLLRAVAFCLFLERYEGNLKRFLDTTARRLNKRWSHRTEVEVEGTVNDIEAAIDAAYSIFGDGAFQRYDGGRPLGRFNRAIFDIMVVTLRQPLVRQAAMAASAKVASLFVELLNDDREFSAWTQATTKSGQAVFGRIRTWAGCLSELLGVELDLGIELQPPVA